MSIDWITVAAQIANFLVLVWLLKRFLYRPILDGIDAREAEIKDRMQEAAHATQQAQAVKNDYSDKVKALDATQMDMADAIRKAAEQQRDVLLAEAQNRVQTENALWQVQRDQEAQKYTAALHSAGASALLALTRKAVIDLSGVTLENQMAQHLLQQITPMASDLQTAAGHPVAALVTSHSPLPKPAQTALRSGLRDLFPKITVRFEVREDQTPGLILQIGGAQLEWSVDTYVDGLDALVKDRIAAGSYGP